MPGLKGASAAVALLLIAAGGTVVRGRQEVTLAIRVDMPVRTSSISVFPDLEREVVLRPSQDSKARGTVRFRCCGSSIVDIGRVACIFGGCPEEVEPPRRLEIPKGTVVRGCGRSRTDENGSQVCMGPHRSYVTAARAVIRTDETEAGFLETYAQSGVVELVALEPGLPDDRWSDEMMSVPKWKNLFGGVPVHPVGSASLGISGEDLHRQRDLVAAPLKRRARAQLREEAERRGQRILDVSIDVSTERNPIGSDLRDPFDDEAPETLEVTVEAEAAVFSIEDAEIIERILSEPLENMEEVSAVTVGDAEILDEHTASVSVEIVVTGQRRHMSLIGDELAELGGGMFWDEPSYDFELVEVSDR